jgi:glycine/D-amino acid oxidase-like deaminating enzyme
LDVKVINEAVEGIDFEKSEVSIAGGRLRYKKLLVTLGSNSSMYLPKGAMPDLVQGVGTALELRDRGINRAIADSRIVIRTVNRGGAQCGFHLVPREAGFYLGAGNYIMLPGNSDHRLETIRYLFNTFERELCGPSSSYLLEGNLVKGHRPRAIDGYPVIGMIKGMPGVYVATGTNRAGLTWAPKIATQVLEWLDGEVSEDTKFSAMVSPSRANIDFGSEKEALAYYAESRLSAAVEHGKIENSAISRENELRRIHLYAEQLLGEARRVSLDDSSVPHPDHWSVILDRANTCIS